VRELLEANPDDAKRVVDAVILARDARVAVTAARKKKRQARSGE
jgi:hypothetical protein